MDLKNLDLLNLQTSTMRIDITTIALCKALEPFLMDLANKSAICLFRNKIDNLTESVLDEIALEENIFWYDASANIDIKRKVIKSSQSVYQTLGTNAAIEQVISDYFGDGKIEEWYEYGGQPFHFRVVTSNRYANNELAQQFANTVEKVKRKSTRLQEIIVIVDNEFTVYSGFGIHIGDNMSLKQEV